MRAMLNKKVLEIFNIAVKKSTLLEPGTSDNIIGVQRPASWRIDCSMMLKISAFNFSLDFLFRFLIKKKKAATNFNSRVFAN